MPTVFDVLGKDHAAVKRMLTELEKGPTAGSGANGNELTLCKKLVEQLVIEESKHEALEEMYFWPGLRTALSAEEAAELGGKLEQGKKTAPTRPHPHTPPSPGVLRTAGPAAAAADRARDAATGRGE